MITRGGPSRVLAALGLAALCAACGADAAQPSTAPPTPTPTPAGGEHRFSVPGFGDVVAVLPPGWTIAGQTAATLSEEDGTPISLSVWAVERVYADPCRWSGTDAKIGRSAPALAQALAAQPGRGSAQARSVQAAGRSAQWITLEVAEDADLSTCDEGELRSWPPVDGQDVRSHQPGEVDEIYVFQFGRRRVVVDASYFGDISSEELGGLRRLVDSLEFDRGPDRP